MESQPQNPEFRKNPENFHPCGIQHREQVDMLVQERFKSVCTSAQSYHCHSFPSEETLDPWLPIEHPLKTDHTVWICRLI